MIKCGLRYTQQAVNDLLKIKRYIAYDLKSPKTSERIAERIISAIESLETFPERGAYLFKYCPREIRFLSVGNYLITYRLKDGYAEILRILYKRQNVKTQP